MDRMKIIGCGFRGWALSILEKAIKWPGVELLTMTSKEDVRLETFDEHSPIISFFYGWIWPVPEEITQKYLCLGLHPSKLPEYRGIDPIQAQIMNGEVESAVSIFKMTKEMDAGDLCSQVPLSLEGDLWEILDSVVNIGTMETLRIIREIQAGSLKFWRQEGEVITCKGIESKDSEITAEELAYGPARYLYNKIRSLQSPYPNAYIKCADGKRLYLTASRCE